MLNIYSKCKLNREFVDKKKNHYIKEMVDNFFSTCLYVSIFKVMFTSNEHDLGAWLFVTQTGGLLEIQLTANGSTPI